ncbi:AbrB/MazE/SpoVT family DNA-binding domain-containing protein [Magnetofaba australis]|uniref:Putative transcriptional regulator, AbrB family n=1 Tax=Magnetofaba australis IT-1 TaxID=1434232 RepID=A0A1Y2K7D9_9PROT|nr:AbrB/MazE/SpoVT family DNA-binding domain-containing protein [Magnetofaba australis]OSM06138.1 putative transcriptional regulator, AbrB family [Magnetofaba australis IT-1]
MPTATLTSKGQITLPKAVRDHFHLHPGDKVSFQLTTDGAVILTPLNADITELAGILHQPKRAPVTLEQMDAAIATEAKKQAR